MRYDPNKPDRKIIRLKQYDYSKTGYYFVTICTEKHIKYFGRVVNEKMIFNDIGTIAARFWEQIPRHFNNIELDRWVVMPNHVHGILLLYGPNYFKNGVCGDGGGVVGGW